MRILTLAAVLATCAAAQKPAPKAHFHHLHLNATNPATSIDFYTGKFDCERAKFSGEDAVWAQKSWILFNKVKDGPASDITSAIWHFGWGAEDMPAEYRKQVDSGTKFQTPITDISDLMGKPAGSFFFGYVDGPDHALIELNTAAHHHFGHIHLLSDDPVAAGEWYQRRFGVTPIIQRQARVYRGFHVAPMASFVMDNVNFVIFPAEYARDAMPDLWKDRKTFDPSKGHVVDHLAFSVDSLRESAAALRNDGVKITEDNGKSILLEGPDKIRIEPVEGQAHKE